MTNVAKSLDERREEHGASQTRLAGAGAFYAEQLAAYGARGADDRELEASIRRWRATERQLRKAENREAAAVRVAQAQGQPA